MKHQIHSKSNFKEYFLGINDKWMINTPNGQNETVFRNENQSTL